MNEIISILDAIPQQEGINNDTNPIIKIYESLRTRVNKTPDRGEEYVELIQCLNSAEEGNAGHYDSKREWYWIGNWPTRNHSRYKINLNVKVTTDSVKELVRIFSNYPDVQYKFKFGGDSVRKIDSINMYFTERPCQELINEIIAFSEKYQREDEYMTPNRLGNFISESRITSISLNTLIAFVNDMNEVPAGLKIAINDLRPRNNMLSEGMYYSVLKFLRINGVPEESLETLHILLTN